MAAISQLAVERSEAERISAQRGAYVVPLDNGEYQALDRDGWPIEFLNSYLRNLGSQSESTENARNTAYMRIPTKSPRDSDLMAPIIPR